MVSDFRPAEGNKAKILAIKPAPAGLAPEALNGEWVEISVTMASDVANWRVQHLKALWTVDIAKSVSWDWVYTFGSPAFVTAGEIYRIHSGSRVRAATHPLPDDLVPGRKHVYVAGPPANARAIWERGDYVRLLDAFGTVIDEVVVWPAEEPAPVSA